MIRNKLIDLLILVPFAIFALAFIQCSNDDTFEDLNTATETNELCGVAWVCSNEDINISIGQDYADRTCSELILYFVDTNVGMSRFNMTVEDSEGDSWGN